MKQNKIIKKIILNIYKFYFSFPDAFDDPVLNATFVTFFLLSNILFILNLSFDISFFFILNLILLNYNSYKSQFFFHFTQLAIDIFNYTSKIKNYTLKIL